MVEREGGAGAGLFLSGAGDVPRSHLCELPAVSLGPGVFARPVSRTAAAYEFIDDAVYDRQLHLCVSDGQKEE